MRRIPSYLIVLTLGLGAGLSPTLAPAVVTLPQSVNGCGGLTMSDPGGYQAMVTLGQAIIGVSGGPFIQQAGYWFQESHACSGVGEPESGPTAFWLAPGAPNPFRDQATIRFALPRPSTVAIQLYDVSGRVVRDVLEASLGAGFHEVELKPDGLSSGIYYCRMTAGDFRKVHRIVLLK
jgi:hypothetical protein